MNPFQSSRLNVLVIGYDSSINGPPRADTIILGSVELKTGEIGVLSIPRDTRVDIPGYGINRINASHAYGGIELTSDTLEKFLDIPIDYYIETDFQGFARIVDAIGGVEINIKKPLHYTDEAGGLYIDLAAGKQVLDGTEALQYVRYRESTKGDIGRVERQQKFLKAMMKKIMRPDIIMKLPAIYKETRKTINTNIPLQDISPFIRYLKDIDLDRFKTVMVPGKPEYINGASYWIADEKELQIVVNNLIRSKEYIKNNQYNLAILNGNGLSGQAGEVAAEMEKYGFNVVEVGNADNFNYKTTLIKYFNKNERGLAGKIKKVIGGNIKYIEQKNEENKFIEIIVGADFE